MMQRAEAAMGSHGENAALDRGLLKSLAHIVPARAAAETFHWVIEPVEGVIVGVVYMTDRSSMALRSSSGGSAVA